jgi:hypothetical protein
MPVLPLVLGFVDTSSPGSCDGERLCLDSVEGELERVRWRFEPYLLLLEQLVGLLVGVSVRLSYSSLSSRGLFPSALAFSLLSSIARRSISSSSVLRLFIVARRFVLISFSVILLPSFRLDISWEDRDEDRGGKASRTGR